MNLTPLADEHHDRCPACGTPITVPSAPTAIEVPCPACEDVLWIFARPGLREIFGFQKFAFADRAILDKRDAIGAILDRLVTCGQVAAAQREAIFAAALKREELGSTGIGRGIALPHARHQHPGKIVGALAKFQQGIAFDSLDGQPVHLVCLLISPTDRPGDHARVLEGVSRRLRNNPEELFSGCSTD